MSVYLPNWKIMSQALWIRGLMHKLTLYQMKKCWTCPNWKHLQTTNVAKMEILDYGGEKNIVGKGENAAYQYFLFFLQCCQVFCFRVNKRDFCLWKSRKHCGKRIKTCLPAFSPYPIMFSKYISFRVVKRFLSVIRVENIPGKWENAGYQHFLLTPQCFQKSSLSGSLKVGILL